MNSQDYENKKRNISLSNDVANTTPDNTSETNKAFASITNSISQKNPKVKKDKDTKTDSHIDKGNDNRRNGENNKSLKESKQSFFIIPKSFKDIKNELWFPKTHNIKQFVKLYYL